MSKSILPVSRDTDKACAERDEERKKQLATAITNLIRKHNRELESEHGGECLLGIQIVFANEELEIRGVRLTHLFSDFGDDKHLDCFAFDPEGTFPIQGDAFDGH